MVLTFSTGNTKLLALQKEQGCVVTSFDLLAGHTCPAANLCKAWVDFSTRKLIDGDDMIFRCYAASMETRYPNSFKAHFRNWQALRGKSISEAANMILSELPKGVKIVRIHASGDYFSKRYFLAWVKVAQSRPDVKFFGYTKILTYVRYPKPDNFRLVYSFGGKMDAELTDEPTCFVVFSVEEAKSLGVPVACLDNETDDFGYIMSGLSFALLVHGTQPAKKPYPKGVWSWTF